MEYNVGDKVLLSTKNISLKTPAKGKVLPLYIGPYEIRQRVGNLAYMLSLPPSMKIHNVFHVSLLSPYVDSNRRVAEAPPILVEGQEEFEVANILDHKSTVGRAARDGPST